MENSIIIENVKKAFGLLISNDYWLLTENLSERSITHKLAEYIQLFFKDLNVDCEYNGDIKYGLEGRKRIYYIKAALFEEGLLTANEIQEVENEIADRLAYPDIIVHSRGNNEENICIVEVKKSKSQIPSAYDEIKLKAYTTIEYGNELKYQIGIFAEVITGEANLGYNLKYFINGAVTEDP